MKKLILVFFSILIGGCSSNLIAERQIAQQADVSKAGFYSEDEIKASRLESGDIRPGSVLDFTSVTQEMLLNKKYGCSGLYSDGRDDVHREQCYVCLKTPPAQTLSFPREKFEVSKVEASEKREVENGYPYDVTFQNFYIKTSRGNEAILTCRNMDEAKSIYQNLKSVGITLSILKPEEAELHGTDEPRSTVTKKEKILKRVPASKN